MNSSEQVVKPTSMQDQAADRSLPVESRLFFGNELKDFMDEQYKKGWIILTRFKGKQGSDSLYEYQRVAR